MALLPDQKFSTFQSGGNPTTGDIIVGLRGGINTQFTWPTPTGISSITGTADEVLVNGTSGSPITGAVTLTTPQPIAPSSSPTFANLTVTTELDVANLRLAGNTISSTNTNGNINIIPNGTGIIIGLGSTSFASRQGMEIQKSGNEVNYTAGSFANAVGSAPKFNAYKSRSTTVGVHVAVQTSDELGFYTAWGDDGTTFSQAAQIRILAGSTISSGIVSGTLQLNTSNTSGVMTNALTISDSQIVSLTNPLPVSSGGSGNTTFTAYSVICAGTTATGAFQNVSGLGSANQVLVSNGAGALPSWQSVPGLTPAALTKTDDTNVTLTLGGTPSTALLQATSITAGWSGQLSPARGGTGVNNGSSTLTLAGNLATSGAFSSTFTMTGATNVTFPTSGTLATTSGSVSSVSGTANRITSTGGTTPVIDISASYVGQSSITTLGTITTGVWNGTTVAIANGGTGITSFGTGVQTALGQNVTGSGGIVLATAPTLTQVTFSTTSGIIGTTTNNNAAAGSVGEYQETVLLSSGSLVSLSSGTATNIVQLTSLGAGDWDVWGTWCLDVAGASSMAVATGWISSTSATAPDLAFQSRLEDQTLNNSDVCLPIAARRFSLASPTTIYMSMLASYTGGTIKGFGAIYARRPR